MTQVIFITKKWLQMKMYVFIALLFWFVIPVQLQAQIFSTDCSTAIGQQLTVGCVCTPITWNVNTTLGSPAPTLCGGVTPNGADGWGWFQATASSTIISYTNTTQNAVLYVYSGSCGSLVQISCSNSVTIGTETVTAATVVGQNYFVRVVRTTGTTVMNGTLCVYSLNPPSNDDPCGATALTVNASCTYGTFSNACATGSAGITAPGCAGYLGADVWFTVVVPALGGVTIATNTGTILDGGMAIYSGTCGALTLYSCDDNSGPGNMPQLSVDCFAPGTTLWIRVWENGNDNNGTFRICATSYAAPNTAGADEPCSATALTVNSTCTYSTYTNACATASAGITAPGCAGYLGGDVWFTVTVPASGGVTVSSNTATIIDGGMAIYSGTCGSLTLYACDDNTGPGNMPQLSVDCFAPGTVLYVRFWENGNDNNGTFQICASSYTAPNTAGADEPCSATALTVNSSCVYSTYTNACATASAGITAPGCAGYSGGDVWFTVTVPASGGVTITTNTATITDGGMAVYSGSCSSLSLITCDDNSGPGNMPSISITCFPPGTVLWVRFWENGNNNNGTFQICAQSATPAAVSASDEPCTATVLTVNSSCSYSTYTNGCATATSGVTAPGCAGYAGGDVWFSAIVPASGTITVSTNTGVITDGGMAVYSGSCNSLTLVTCDDDNGPGTMPMISLSCLTPGSTLWIRFWENGNNNNGTFQICAYETTPASCTAPSNDYPCNATSLPIGVTLNGDNTCATSCNDPSLPSCWTNGNSNTLWYSIVCPATGKIRVRTYLGTLTNTQIALYSGSCSSLTQVATGCNDDATPCTGAPTQLYSEINVGGLTVGQTYYLAVDGYNSLVGTFNVAATDGSAFPAIPQQDCSYATQICSQTTTVGDPGFTGAGNTCDFSTPLGCFSFGGERNSVFYSFTISASGTLLFDITPNTSSTDYDWMLWDVTGLASPCTNISGGTLSPVRCNFSGTTGTTGIRTGYVGTSETAGGPPFCAPLTVTAGQQFLLMINNYTSNSTGFSLNYGTSPLSYPSVPTTLVWTGGVNTDWFNALNWGGCAIPACGIDAIVVNGPANQPVISAPGAVCQSITINPGASLSINGANSFRICQDFTNNGTLNATVGSTILLNNSSVTQNLNGNMVGTSQFSNLTITKSSLGTINLNQSLDVGANFTISNSTSVFNTNGNYIKIGGIFINTNANSSFSNIGTGTLEFFGSGAQTYINSTGTLTLNNVVVNNSGSGVTLSGANSNLILGSNGTLTFANGKIITGASNEVTVTNPAPAAVSTGTTSSFVDGYLRRYISTNTGAYDFPVGNSTKGFQRANINFTSAPSSPFNLLAKFNNWSGIPNGPVSYECTTADYSAFPAFDNGYWTISASTTVSALYNATLYNLNYTNNVGSLTWSIMKRSPSGSGTWALNGTCDAASTASAAMRDGLSGFSDFATVQFNQPLPIHLLYFTAERKDNFVRCEWATATEINNDYFVVQRSRDLQTVENIGNVRGAGNSSSTLYYSFDDKSPYEGVNYYRLKQIDFDGKTSLSEWVAVRIIKNENQVLIYPNPATSSLSCEFISSTKDEVNLIVTDVLGKIIFNEKKAVVPGQNKIDIPVASLADGFYFLEIAGEDNGSLIPERKTKFTKVSN